MELSEYYEHERFLHSLFFQPQNESNIFDNSGSLYFFFIVKKEVTKKLIVITYQVFLNVIYGQSLDSLKTCNLILKICFQD